MQVEQYRIFYVMVPCEDREKIAESLNHAVIIQAYLITEWQRSLVDEDVKCYAMGIDAAQDSDKRFRVFIQTNKDITEWLEGLEYPPSEIGELLTKYD